MADAKSCAYGRSEGVAGSDGGGGRLIKVGIFEVMACSFGDCLMCAVYVFGEGVGTDFVLLSRLLLVVASLSDVVG